MLMGIPVYFIFVYFKIFPKKVYDGFGEFDLTFMNKISPWEAGSAYFFILFQLRIFLFVFF